MSGEDVMNLIRDVDYSLYFLFLAHLKEVKLVADALSQRKPK